MRGALLSFVLAMPLLAQAAPHLYADPYPATGVQPDSVTMSVNGGTPIACALETVAGGKQPKCDLASLAAGTYTLVMTACKAGGIVNTGSGATITQEACSSSAPFALVRQSSVVVVPAGLAVAP